MQRQRQRSLLPTPKQEDSRQEVIQFNRGRPCCALLWATSSRIAGARRKERGELSRACCERRGELISVSGAQPPKRLEGTPMDGVSIGAVKEREQQSRSATVDEDRAAADVRRVGGEQLRDQAEYVRCAVGECGRGHELGAQERGHRRG